MMKRFSPILLLLVLGAAGVFALGGCGDDDGVTPNEQPEITAEDAAGQAAFVAVSLMEVLDELASKVVPSVRYVAEDCVYGSYWKDSDHVWTDAENYLTLDFDCNGVQDEENNGEVTFDIVKLVDMANGDGTLVIGSVEITFVLANVELDPGNFPVGGTLTVSTGGHTAVVQFYANHTADVTVDGGQTWNINLSNGDITPA